MIYLVLENVKPLEVIVGRLAAPKRALLVQPVVSTLGKFAERLLSDVIEQTQVIVQRVTSNLSPCLFAELQKRPPLLSFPDSKSSPLERVDLIRHLNARDVTQKGRNCITLGVVQVIELARGEILHRRKRGVPRIVHHHHEPADLGRESGNLLDQKRADSTPIHLQSLPDTIFRCATVIPLFVPCWMPALPNCNWLKAFFPMQALLASGARSYFLPCTAALIDE